MSHRDRLVQNLAALRSRFGDDAMDRLRGRFHAHTTVRQGSERDVQQLRAFCTRHRHKLTLIDLADGSGRQQRDAMVTQHFHDDESGALERIVQALLDVDQQLTLAGLETQRLKLEHESLPTISQFDRSCYREVHIKLRLEATRFDSDYERLLSLGRELGFTPSRNPRERTAQTVHQFVNSRLYEGDLAQTDANIDRMLSRLDEEGFEAVHVRRETSVLDTNQELDAWWA